MTIFLINNITIIDINIDGYERAFFQKEFLTSVAAAHFLFAFSLFFIGLLGVIFNYRNFLVTMMSVELLYLGAIMYFILVSIYFCDPKGQIYALIFLIIAASESAIGLGILIVLYRFGKTIDFSSYEELKG